MHIHIQIQSNTIHSQLPVHRTSHTRTMKNTIRKKNAGASSRSRSTHSDWWMIHTSIHHWNIYYDIHHSNMYMLQFICSMLAHMHTYRHTIRTAPHATTSPKKDTTNISEKLGISEDTGERTCVRARARSRQPSKKAAQWKLAQKSNGMTAWHEKGTKKARKRTPTTKFEHSDQGASMLYLQKICA